MAQYGDAIAPRPVAPKVAMRKRNPSQAFDLYCAECGKHFVGHKKNRKFCEEDCRLRYNVKKHRQKKAVMPAKYTDSKTARNIEWNRFLQGWREEPPKLPGRPTKFQRRKIDEYERSTQILRQLKRERLSK